MGTALPIWIYEKFDPGAEPLGHAYIRVRTDIRTWRIKLFPDCLWIRRSHLALFVSSLCLFSTNSTTFVPLGTLEFWPERKYVQILTYDWTEVKSDFKTPVRIKKRASKCVQASL